MLKASSARQATPDLTDPLFAAVCTRWLSLRLTIWPNSNGCLSFASVVRLNRLQLVYNAQAATCSTSALLRRLGCNKSAWYLRHVQKLPIVPRWPPELPMLCRGVLLVARPSASLSCYRLLTLPGETLQYLLQPFRWTFIMNLLVAKSTCRCKRREQIRRLSPSWSPRSWLTKVSALKVPPGFVRPPGSLCSIVYRTKDLLRRASVSPRGKLHAARG